MKVLGVRCSNRDYTSAILGGTREKPKVLECDTVRYPKGFRTAQSLKWLLQEMESKIKKHDVRRVVMKRYEGMSRGKAYEQRVEHEAMVALAAANRGLTAIFKKPKSTIAKDLGLKGRGHYLRTSLDTSVIPQYDDYEDKAQEAILCAWSELP